MIKSSVRIFPCEKDLPCIFCRILRNTNRIQTENRLVNACSSLFVFVVAIIVFVVVVVFVVIVVFIFAVHLFFQSSERFNMLKI